MWGAAWQMRTDTGFILHQDLDNFVCSSTTACFLVAADVHFQKVAIPLSLSQRLVGRGKGGGC
jgi:hypothetical protein